jgi:outer membrane lipoprotein carrier protein
MSYEKTGSTYQLRLRTNAGGPVMKILRAVNTIAAILFLAFTSSCGESASTKQQSVDIASQEDTIDGYGQPMTTEQRLAEIERLVENIESYRFTKTTEEMGQAMTIEQETTFKKPDKINISSSTQNIEDGINFEIYSSGNIQWLYYPAEKRAIKNHVKKRKNTGQERIKVLQNHPEDMIEYIEDKVTDEGLAYVFKVTLGSADWRKRTQPGEPIPMELVYWIGVDTGLPIKEFTIGEDGNTLKESTYSDYEINPEIDDSVFEFTPPEGVQVDDTTKQGRRGRRRQRR